MKTLNNIVTTLIVLAMIAALGAGAYYGIKFAIDLFRGLDTQIANIIYVSLAVVLSGALIISMIGRRLQARAKRNQLLMQKEKAYKRFINAWSSMLSKQEARKTHGEQSPLNEMQSTENELILLASDNVIKKYAEFRNQGDGSEDKVNVLDRLLLAMRKDLGHRNVGFNKGDLADMFLGDIQLIEQGGIPAVNTDTKAHVEG